MKNKKAVELSMNVIVMAGVLLIVLIVSLVIFTDLVGDNVNDIGDKMGIAKDDYDADGVKDFVDICPCEKGEERYGGCSSPEKMNSKENDRSCLS
ncbi:MAG: hypothetical protein PHV16_01280 [Candidatus Nanoarchaeia archaeon]|nr:hypothetical protein [Candidatus Nanoarchaeia archaeon]